MTGPIIKFIAVLIYCASIISANLIVHKVNTMRDKHLLTHEERRDMLLVAAGFIIVPLPILWLVMKFF